MTDSNFQPAWQIAQQTLSGTLSCETRIESLLQCICKHNVELKAFTHIAQERAIAQAKSIDQRISQGENPGPLAGVPFAVKNLYDIEGLQTLAGSKINLSHPPAAEDALLIQRLQKAGAILMGGLNMGEYAYDFTGENSHWGNCANPWDIQRMAGGSSSGSGSATAAGLAPISLGSDTNGSIRVPASFCGVFGLKPTYGRLPRTGSFPFCDSLDHLGVFARSTRDVALSFDVMQGYDASDHACQPKNTIPTQDELEKGLADLRICKAGGYFENTQFPQAMQAVEKICAALKIHNTVELPGAAEGRSAAYLVTNMEGSQFHQQRLQEQPENFDPDTRDRFLAGLTLPASWYLKAQQVRRWYAANAARVFKHTDVLIAPATPFVAPLIGQKEMTINGERQLLRPNLGYFTQPISAIGLPSIVVPTTDDETGLPIGVQIIAAPWHEDHCLRVAHALEQSGFKARQPNSSTNGSTLIR